MRMPSRTPEWARLARKEQWRRDRAAAAPLRSAYPDVSLVRIELSFADSGPRPPAAQSHAMHPPANAYFEFPCPFADCDGNFDLNDAVRKLVGKSSRTAKGELVCKGLRAKDGGAKQTCDLHADYVIAATYRATDD
jgi:hypothetical protein